MNFPQIYSLLVSRLWVLLIFVLTFKALGLAIEVERDADPTVSYRERRDRLGLWVGFRWDRFLPKEYLSLVDAEPWSEFMSGRAFGITSFEAGPKLNFFAGSLALICGVGTGQAKNSLTNETRTISINLMTAKLMLALDNLTENPVVVPYIAGGAYRAEIDERASLDNSRQSLTSGVAMVSSYGVLISLNKLEPSSAGSAYVDLGIENTYLDIYAINFGPARTLPDEKISSSGQYGFGLKVEF
ncbi:MAG: hypothetical protein N2578_02620 [Bdellovibrionaceae bacterium]|nr:hypothetical protein [Pseudobdellovibrionaceae bacterium]